MEILPVGQTLAGKYRIEGLLGRGGMGVVYTATHLVLGHRVAIKTLGIAVVFNQVARARFAREARAMARLRGPHVCRVLDADVVGTTPYVVLECLEGADLGRVLLERSRLPPSEAVDHILETCAALAEAHAAGIIHRDIKPSNLFLATGTGAGGRATIKVLDFGISKLLEPFEGDETERLTQAGSFVGSLRYMAPEQFRAGASADVRTDVWGLGVTLYELLSGQRPFRDGRSDVAKQICTMVVPSLRIERPEVPEGLDKVVMRCLAKDPSDRFATVPQLAAALVPFAPAGSPAATAWTDPDGISTLGAVSTVPDDPVPPEASPQLPRQRDRIRVLLVAVVVVLLGAVGWLAAGVARRTARTIPQELSAAPSAPEILRAAGTHVLAGTVIDSWTVGFQSDRGSVKFSVLPSSLAFEALIRNELDVALVSRKVTDEETRAALSSGLALGEHLVGFDALAIVVHSDNPVSELSMADLRAVFTGKIRDWRALEGTPGRIVPLLRPEELGEHYAFRALVLGPEDRYLETETVLQSRDLAERVQRDRGAISYVAFAEVASNKALRIRTAEEPGMAPSTTSIRSQRYPLVRGLYLYTRGPARGLAREFVTYVTTRGQSALGAAGLVALGTDSKSGPTP